MKKVLLSASVVAMVIVFAGCKKNNPAPATNAAVMFVNGCAGSANVDVTVNNTKLVAASNLAFFKTSGYQPVTAASGVSLSFSSTAQGNPLASGTENLAVNSNYSVFIGGLGSGTSTSFVFSADDLTAPASGMAKVRFVNLSSDSLNEGCFIGSQKLDSNVAVSTVTPYFSITAATGVSVLFLDPAAPTKLCELTGQSFSAGKIYTIMLTGTSKGLLTSQLTLTVINNN
jgi:uncharacterized protein DUF4397